MSVFKTTFSRALQVYPSDAANIPYPTVVINKGVNSSDATTTINDASANFITNNVQPGDIVISNGIMSTVTIVESETKIECNDLVDVQYTVYQASSQTGLGNQGCYLYIGSTDSEAGPLTINVTTIGGDVVDFYNVPIGTILPVQVIKLNITGTANVSNIIALW